MPDHQRLVFKPFLLDLRDERLWKGSQAIRIGTKALVVLHTQKRHSQPLTSYKSMLKGACDRIGPQECPTHSRLHPLPSAVYYDHSHLLAPVRHGPVSWDARHLEKPASPHPMLAGVHASPLSRAENPGRAGPLDTGLDHGLALSPRAQGHLLEYPSAGDMVGRRSPAYLTPTQGRDALSRGRWQCETQARAAASGSPKGTQKRASAVVFWRARCPVDCHVGRLSLPRGLSPDSAQDSSRVPHGKRVVP